jgi:hypothetical protein
MAHPRAGKHAMPLSIWFATACLLAGLLGVPAYGFPYLPGVIWNALSFTCLSCGLLAILVWVFIENGLRYLTPLTRKLFGFWLLLCVQMLILGYFTPSIGGQPYLSRIIIDLKYATYFTIAFIYVNPCYLRFFVTQMMIIGVIGILAGLWAVSVADYNISAINERSYNTWSLPYYLWWMLVNYQFWFFYAINYRRHVSLAYGTVGLYLLLGLIFLKRISLFNVVMLFIVAGVIAVFRQRRKQTQRTLRSSRFMLYIIYSIILSIVLFCGLMVTSGKLTTDMHVAGNLFSLTIDRFTNVINGESEFDRGHEFAIYLQQTTTLDMLMGNGFGIYNTLLDPASPALGLHVGWANIFYKGGIPLVIFYAILVFGVVKNVKHQVQKNEIAVFTGIAICYFCSLFFEGHWNQMPNIFIYATAILYVINNTPAAVEHRGRKYGEKARSAPALSHPVLR